MNDSDPLDLKRALDALGHALELDDAQRPAWLASLRDDDPALAERVQALLVAHAHADAVGFMQEPARVPGADTVGADASDALCAGAMVGAYRLVREIGAGGMGVVWLAERADGLFKRPVALKLPHRGLHAAVLAERFAREREILAALDHPHIARLHDAGVTPHGQPFLAIEYVEGERLNDWCDRQQLGVAHRIGLFIDVLRAVQYAHGQLVVHRDLKPANILVTREGQVKLLDFGIARLLADSAAEQTSLTQEGARALTPDYASPEQITGGAIGTASDVYSLGVVLYELLVGQRPYKLKRGTRGALEDAIVAVDVQRPSEAAIDAAAARSRGSDAARLRRRLRGDLDTIVLTTLAREPAARYGTASAFAEDLRRHLDGEPVQARPESALYRAGKFMRRHRVAVGAATAVLLLVMGSAGVAVVQGMKARQEAAIAAATRDFVVGVFERNSSSQPNAEKARSTTARQLLDLGRDQLLSGPAGEPAVRQAMMATLSEMYFHLGLGNEALKLDRARLALNRNTFGELDLRTLDAQRTVGEALLQVGTQPDELLALAKDTIEKLDRIGDRDSLLRARSEVLLAETLSQRFDPGAFAQQQRAVDLMARRYSDDGGFPILMGNYARSQLTRGDAAAARASVQLALDAWSRLPSRPKNQGAYLLGIAAQVHDAQDNLGLAESTLRQGMQMEQESYEIGSWNRYMAWSRLSRVLARTGRAAEVLGASPEVLARLGAAADTPPWFQARVLSIVLGAAVEAGEARALDDGAAALQRAGCKHDPFTESLCRQTLMEARHARGDLAGASELLLEVESRAQAMLEQPSMPAGIPIDVLTSVARVHLAAGALQRAASAAEQARRKLEAQPVKPVILDLRLGLVEREILRAQGHAAAALALTQRLQQRIATHSDRPLLSTYERALAG